MGEPVYSLQFYKIKIRRVLKGDVHKIRVVCVLRYLLFYECMLAITMRADMLTPTYNTCDASMYDVLP